MAMHDAGAKLFWQVRLPGNAGRIAQALRSRGPSTRSELMASTGLSRPTVSATLAELIEVGLVAEHARPSTRPVGGRPAAAVRLTRMAGLAIGADIGRRHVRVAVADLGHDVLAERSVRLTQDADGQPHEVLDLTTRMIDEVLDDVGGGRTDVVGVGLGIPAPITHEGRIGSPGVLPGWADLDTADELARRLGSISVTLDNDANLGALGEYVWGAGRDCAVLVYVKVATGIGAGIVLDGRLFRGSAGTAGELGHVTLDARGPVCRCGNRGCVELTAGGRALVAQAGLAHPEITDVADLVRLAEKGDPGCRRLLADAGVQLGIALGGLVNLVDPARILLGGELGAATTLLLEPLRRGLADTGMPAAVAAVEVAPAALGERASALGGVAAVLTA